MKLEDCKVGLKVKVFGKTVFGCHDTDGKLFPALERGWGYINFTSSNDSVFLSKTLPDVVGEAGAYSPNDLEPYIEEEQEYRQLKDITPRAIYRAAPTNALYSVSDCFMQEFSQFVLTFELEYEDVLSFPDLIRELENRPKWEKWLIEHGFIEKVVKPEEITHRTGDRFLNEENRTTYLVAKTGENTVALINIDSGNTWAGNIQVKDYTEITETELKQLTGSWHFTKIEGK